MTADFVTGACVGAGGLIGVLNVIHHGVQLWRSRQGRKPASKRRRFYGGPFDGMELTPQAAREAEAISPLTGINVVRTVEGVRVGVGRYQNLCADGDLYYIGGENWTEGYE